ncbi:hypothetical protein IT41_01410 [Paracoccus halophilus]|uniref:Uncharacterized protein n=1 Tax=Paracoccus halophilus TaxID=376733 RepID=A0A099F884_9RHOB|nr:hypothetical protein IT41_01410 [Paracoccus halophilus]
MKVVVWFINQQELGLEKAHIGNDLNELEDTSPSQINWNALTSRLRKLHINEEVFFCVMLDFYIAGPYDVTQDFFNFNNLTCLAQNSYNIPKNKICLTSGSFQKN